MATSFNNGTLTGIVSGIRFVKDSGGTPFEFRFTLGVKRKGKDAVYDNLPIRYVGEKRMKYATYIRNGDVVSVNGEYRSENYESGGKKYYNVFFRADDIMWTPGYLRMRNESKDKEVS